MAVTKVTRQGNLGTSNLVLNGGMAVSQRGTLTGLGSGTSDEYTLDRWSLSTIDTSTARWTVSQETSGGTSGKDPWLKCLNTTADASPGAGEGQLVQQKMEGYTAQPLLGSSDGYIDGFTVSADMILYVDGSSSISFPATVSCVAYTIDTGRGCIIDATITSAATWQRVNFVFPDDTSGTFNIDNTVGFRVGFGLYAGTSRDATAGSWFSAATNAAVSTAAVNIADATGNYLGFTNVQCEVGPVASDFVHEDYATTYNKCLRYFEYQPYVVNTFAAIGFSNTTTSHQCTLQFTEKRASGPTIAVSTASQWEVNRQGTDQTCTGLSGASASRVGMTFIGIVSSGLTAGEAAAIRSNNSGNYVSISSEL